MLYNGNAGLHSIPQRMLQDRNFSKNKFGGWMSVKTNL